MDCTYIDSKGNVVTEEQHAQQSEFDRLQSERMMNLSDTGPVNNARIELFAPGNTDAGGVFTNYIQFKRTQLYELNRRLNKVKSDKKGKGLSIEQFNKLNTLERELTTQIEGRDELGIKGLKQEIKELMNNQDINAVGYYAEKDIERISRLSKSDNIDDLREAQRLVDFYNIAATFKKNIDNPFYVEDEIFLSDENGKLTSEYKLAPEIIAKFKEWQDKANQFQNQLISKEEDAITNLINTDDAVKKTYGENKKFSYDELISKQKGLRDTDPISMWTMDITQGIFSNNGLMPQVMFSSLVNSFESKRVWSREIEERVDKNSTALQTELSKMGYSLRASGIGLKGVSYQLFKEITREGNETGGLVQRFNKEFFDIQANAINKFHNSFDDAKLSKDYNARISSFNKAFEELKQWKRENTIMFDFNDKSETYKKSMVDILGQKGYDEHLAKQNNLLNKYQAEKQSMIDTILIEEGKGPGTRDDLSHKGLAQLNYWENNHSPENGVKDYFSGKGLFIDEHKVNSFMTYNVLIPRKYRATQQIDNAGNISFTNTDKSTGYYSEAFSKIEANSVLSEFHDIMSDVLGKIREHVPYDLQSKMAVNTVPALKKTFAEFIGDKNVKILRTRFPAFAHIIEKIRLSFGIIKQSEVSYATLDPITKKTNYKVNDGFLQGNSKAVNEMMYIEKVKFQQAQKVIGSENQSVVINRYSRFDVKSLKPEALVLLAKYINSDISLSDIQSRNLKKITDVTGSTIEIGKYIRDYSIHQVVQSQSFDLGKIAKYFSNLTMGYAARQEALPILDIMKKHYEKIQKPKTQNTGMGIFNANHKNYEMSGVRTNAHRQIDDWFERVVLDNYGGKHFGVHGAEIKDIKSDDGKITTKIPTYGKRIFSNEEKTKIKQINELLQTEKAEQTRKALEEIKSKFGKERTATAIIDNLLSWIRTLRLGYNLSSASTNFLEGVTSNMMLSSMGQYFDPKEIYYGYHVIKASWVKNISFGLISTGIAKRNRMLMDRFNVIMDSKNELQKSSSKTYSSQLSWLNPHELNQRVEYINQSPIMIAMLRTRKIKDKSGKEDTLWNAFNDNGHLRDEFKTEENIKNWEELTGSEYLNFKQNLHAAITLGHGNYDELRGMMAKSNSGGKALMMFKTWIPNALYWRIGAEQDSIQSGQQKVKGIYKSHSRATAGLHGAVVGTALFGPLGSVIGYGAGYGLGAAFGIESHVGIIKETVGATKLLLKKIIGMPVNLVSGKNIIGTGNKTFDDWVGKGNFTAQDAKNLRANMADIAMQLSWMAMILIIKSMFWDDDDKPDDPERIAHNILINRLMNLSSQATMYVNPVAVYKNTIQSNALIQYITDLGKETVRLSEWMHGRDIIQSGYNAGQSGLSIQTGKILMPGILKGNMFGFDTQAQRVFEESPFHPYFKSEEKQEKEANKRARAEYKLQLEENLKDSDIYESDKERDKAIRRQLDEDLPTPAKLKKLGLTREEYEQQKLQAQ